MARRHWFLPEMPDVLGGLAEQAAVTVEGMDAFAAWAAGDAEAATRVRRLEHAADERKRELLVQLRTAFVTPLEPEDVFALSRGLDWILNRAKDTIGEAEVMACPPDPPLADMAALLAAAVHDLAAALARLGGAGGEADAQAAAAIKQERRLERRYRRAMAALLEREDLRDEIARRELYRRCSRMGDAVVDVAERIVYAGVKAG